MIAEQATATLRPAPSPLSPQHSSPQWAHRPAAPRSGSEGVAWGRVSTPGTSVADRSPARERRWRWMSPEETSIGATPQYEANADADRNRVAEPERARIFAARTSPMPCSSVSVVPDAATAADKVAVASAMRRSRRRTSASSSTATRRRVRASTALGRMLRNAPAAASAVSRRGRPAGMS